MLPGAREDAPSAEQLQHAPIPEEEIHQLEEQQEQHETDEEEASRLLHQWDVAKERERRRGERLKQQQGTGEAGFASGSALGGLGGDGAAGERGACSRGGGVQAVWGGRERPISTPRRVPAFPPVTGNQLSSPWLYPDKSTPHHTHAEGDPVMLGAALLHGGVGETRCARTCYAPRNATDPCCAFDDGPAHPVLCIHARNG